MPRLTYHHLFEPADKPAAPILLLLHGTGGSEHDLVRLGRTLAPGAALLSPRGDVSEGGALRFFARIAEGVFDPVEVTRRTNALADFIVAAGSAYGFEARHLTAVGFSNGANIGATLLQLRPESMGAAILFRPMVVLDRPPAAGSLTGKRVLTVNGAVDPLVPLDHPERLATLLRAGGAEVKAELLPVSHGLTPQDVAVAQGWLQHR
jgi:phospholipase/carboxylesterase